MDILDKGGSALHAVEEVVVTPKIVHYLMRAKVPYLHMKDIMKWMQPSQSGTDLNAGQFAWFEELKIPTVSPSW